MELFLEKMDRPLWIGCIKIESINFSILIHKLEITHISDIGILISAVSTYLIKAGGGVIGAVDTTLFAKGVSDSEEELKGWAEVVMRWG